MFRISKKEDAFFFLFSQTTEKALEAAQELNGMLLNYNGNLSSLDRISTIEHECDCIVHDTLNKLNRSFVTPIDREDIDLIIKELDTITDTIDDTAQALKMYNVKKLREGITEFSFLTIQILEELKKLMCLIINMKSNTKKINDCVIKINDIENKGDDLYVQIISELFKKEENPIEVIKWKDIFLYLENTLDQCEKVANIVEGVIIKHV